MDVAFEADPSLRWLFVFAHPDDELAICGWMKRLAQSGAAISSCWMHSTEVRRAESLRVAELIGLKADSLTFLDAPDGRFIEVMPTLARGLADVVREFSPDRLVVPAFEQGHLDHDATNWAAGQAFEGPRFEVPMYHPYTTRFPWMGRFADPSGEQVFALDEELSALKKRCARCFPSQNIWRNIVCSEARDLVMFRVPSMAKIERLRKQTHFDYRTPNLPPRLKQKVEGSRTWARWIEALDAAESLAPQGAATRSRTGPSILADPDR